VDVSARRYRYTGKERDEETGLYYNGARYLAAWLGRWTSADPIGIGADGPGLYNYTRGSPVNYTDPSGTLQLPSIAAQTPKILERAVVEAGQGVASAVDSAWTAIGNVQRRTATDEQAAALRGARATRSDAEPGIVSEVLHGWASRTASWSMRPDPALQGLPEGMKQLHTEGNQELAWKGARSAEVIAKVGEIGIGLQTLASELAVFTGALRIVTKNAPEQLTKKMLQEGARKELLEQGGKKVAGEAGSKILSQGERLSKFYEQLKTADPVKSADDALELLSKTLNRVEDAHSGVKAVAEPGLKYTGRMYPPKADMTTRLADGSIEAITKGQRLLFGPDGSIRIVSRKTGEVVFSKVGQ